MVTFTTKNVNFRVNQPDGAIVTRVKEFSAFATISAFPSVGNRGIVLCGQLQCKLNIAVTALGMVDEFHLGTFKKDVHPFSCHIDHPLRSFSSTQNILLIDYENRI